MSEAATRPRPRRERARRCQRPLPGAPVRAAGPVRAVLRAAAAVDGGDRVQAVRRVAQPQLDTDGADPGELHVGVPGPDPAGGAVVLQQPAHRRHLHRARPDHRLDGGVRLRPDGVPRPQPPVRAVAGHPRDAGDHVPDPQLPHHRPPWLARHLPGRDRPRAVGSLRRVLPPPVLLEPPPRARGGRPRRRRQHLADLHQGGAPALRWCPGHPRRHHLPGVVEQLPVAAAHHRERPGDADPPGRPRHPPGPVHLRLRQADGRGAGPHASPCCSCSSSPNDSSSAASPPRG